MTSPKLVLYLMCLLLGKIAQTTDQKLYSSVRQEKSFISANVGENVTLRCYNEDDDTDWLYWFKQTLGQKPRLISTFHKYTARPTFYHEFNKSRFTLDHGESTNHLTILNVHISDSATYYCATYSNIVVNFAEGSIISVKGSGLNPPPSVHQSASEIIQPGDSVTLNCTVHTGSCDGEHSVYWFKNSEHSPGLIHTRGGRNDQCERKPNTQTHTCDYNLPMENLNLSHAGTYYCAVASCGHILFGNGTKLDFEDEVDSLVYFLSGALAFNSILVVLLAFLVYKMKKRNICQSTESEARLSTPSTANAEGYRDANSLHYAALSVNVPNRSRRQRNINNDECVYSGVKL
ncbi:immunoglobulin kappa light chain-like [Trematomus bernacchii]|uniref:immunoglobulin kappa light chain-like n=1 Tax=Trematomus bernacchii TaxID=40690 RepID=UPI00146F0D0E|nr:immunoglobulin kappa light chain-like [Trematomus bernacchii]